MKNDQNLAVAQDLRITVGTIDGVHEVHLAGELDLASAPWLRDVLVGLVGGTIVIDVGDLSFVDCAGLSVLVLAMGRCETGRRLVLRGAHGLVRRVIEGAGLRVLLEDAAA